MPQRAVILFGHGSRDPQWRQPMDAVAARIAQTAPAVAVRCAFLELEAPDLPAAVRDLASAGATEVRVVPLFLGTGRHAREDLPRLVDQARVAHPGLAIWLQPAVGEEPRVIDLLARIAAGN